MPISKEKSTTTNTDSSRSEPSSPLLPELQAFHQHLHALAQSAVRTVLERVMREELDAFIGASWGECSPKRKGYRNGTYTRDLVTSTGQLEEIKVPRDRAGQFPRRPLTATVAMNRLEVWGLSLPSGQMDSSYRSSIPARLLAFFPSLHNFRDGIMVAIQATSPNTNKYLLAREQEYC